MTVFLEVEQLRCSPKQNRHPDRSAAQWRDLVSARPQAKTSSRSEVATGDRSGGTCCCFQLTPPNKTVIPTEGRHRRPQWRDLLLLSAHTQNKNCHPDRRSPQATPVEGPAVAFSSHPKQNCHPDRRSPQATAVEGPAVAFSSHPKQNCHPDRRSPQATPVEGPAVAFSSHPKQKLSSRPKVAARRPKRRDLLLLSAHTPNKTVIPTEGRHRRPQWRDLLLLSAHTPNKTVIPTGGRHRRPQWRDLLLLRPPSHSPAEIQRRSAILITVGN